MQRGASSIAPQSLAGRSSCLADFSSQPSEAFPQPAVAKDALDDVGLLAFDEADDLHGAATLGADERIDLVDAADKHSSMKTKHPWIAIQFWAAAIQSGGGSPSGNGVGWGRLRSRLAVGPRHMVDAQTIELLKPTPQDRVKQSWLGEALASLKNSCLPSTARPVGELGHRRRCQEQRRLHPAVLNYDGWR
jgi:hypothetical protein